MNDALRVGLVGAGGFGQNHLRALEDFDASGLLKFVAVADPTVQKLQVEKARVEARGVRWFEDYRAMLEACELDAVVISTPIPLHLPMLEAALDRKLAVFLEKPPVPLIQDFLRIKDRPESSRVALGFKLIADPYLWHLKQAMLEGALGTIRRITGTGCWPRLDSYYNRASWAGKILWNEMPVMDGPATNALAHIIHNIMFLGGESLAGFAVPRTACGELYRARPIETYDVCCLNGQWENGVEFAAAFTHAVEQRGEWAITVEGEKGRAFLNAEGVTIEGVAVPAADVSEADTFRTCWLDFHAMATGRVAKPLTSFADCLGYVAATNAMFQSSGKIHDLPQAVVRRFEKGEDGGYDVSSIAAHVEQVGKTGCLFSDHGVPWAVPGVPVKASALRELSINDFLPEAVPA